MVFLKSNAPDIHDDADKIGLLYLQSPFYLGPIGQLNQLQMSRLLQINIKAQAKTRHHPRTSPLLTANKGFPLSLHIEHKIG